MRSSTLASLTTVLLSIHGTAAWNIRRYPPPSVEPLPSTSSLSVSLGLNQKHGDEGHAEGESYGAQPTTTAVAAEEGSIFATFPFIPSSTIPGVSPSVTEPALEEVESSLLAASTTAASTNAPATEEASSIAISTSLGIPSEAETPEAASPKAFSVPAVITGIPTGTHAVEPESTISITTSSLPILSTPAMEERSTVVTSNNANVGASASKSVGEDGQCTQLSFVPTTIFATGEAPTVTVTEAPRTVTQVEVKTAPLESCEAPPASTMTLPASSVQAAEPLTITVTASQEAAAAKETSLAEPVTVTVTAPQDKAASVEQAIITVTASQESCDGPPASTITLQASSIQAAEPVTISVTASQQAAATEEIPSVEPVTITVTASQEKAASVEQAAITVTASQESGEANAALTLASGSSSVAPKPVTITQILTASGDALLEQATVTITAPQALSSVSVEQITVTQIQTVSLSELQDAAFSPVTVTQILTASGEALLEQATITTTASQGASSVSVEQITVTQIQTVSVFASQNPASSPFTVTQILTASGEALLEQATIIQTVTASQESALGPVTITILQTASAETQSCEASTITLGTDIAAYGALEPVTITEVVTQTVSADVAPATITINNNRIAEAKEVPAQVVTAFITKEGVALPAQTITIIPDGIDEIDVEPALPVLPAQPPKQNQNNLEYARTTAGVGSVGPDGQCQCACPCAPDAFPSTTFSFISATTTKSFDAPASEEPTTTLRETRSTFQTIVISGTSTASDAAPTEGVEPIELDGTAVPIIIESALFSTPVISSIPMASFGVGDTTLAPESSPAEPTTTRATVPQVDASVLPDTPLSSALLREPAISSIPAASFGATPASSPAEPTASSSEVDTSIVLATSTLASSTAIVTTIAGSPPEEQAPVFTTTLDGPFETPEIGAIPKSQADGEGGASKSVVDTSIVLDTPTSVVRATSTIAESTVYVTATTAPSPTKAPVEGAPVSTTTIDAPSETPELGAIPKSQAGGGGEFFEEPSEAASGTAMEPGIPSQTAAQAEAAVTPALGGEVGEEDINNYSLSSAIVLGNLGG